MSFVSKRRALGPFAVVAGAFVLLACAVPGCGSDDDTAAPATEAGPIITPGSDGATTGGDSAAGPDGAKDATTDGPSADASDASDAADARDAAPEGPLSSAYVDHDINHVLVTGQSNAVANGGKPVLSTTQPYTNLMFDTGVMPMGTCDGDGCKVYQTPAALVPLVEGDVFFTQNPPYQVETVGNGIADEISKLAMSEYLFGTRAGYPSKHDVLISNHGRSGNTYWCLRKGGCSYNIGRGYDVPFAQGMMEVASGKALAAAAGKSYVVRAAMAIHGESDHYGYVANGVDEFPLDGTDGVAGEIKSYHDGLLEWQRDYEASVKAITGQKEGVPLLISGISGWTTTATSALAQMQIDAHADSAGKVLYVAPGYEFSNSGDCLHYDSPAYRKLGEQFAKVYAKVVFGGETWEPVRPKSITRVGAVITVKYYVPKPPLVFDTTHVTPVVDGALGYTFIDNGTKAAISTVVLTAPDTVVITLAAVPSGVNMRFRYAQNQPVSGDPDYPACWGNGIAYRGGARGNLRDSDDTPSQYGYDLWNWGVNIDVAVP